MIKSNFIQLSQDYKILIYPLFLVLIFGFLTLFNISGSSVSRYNQLFYGSSYKDPNLIFGKPRAIRSDEWSVLTPYTLSQKQVNFSHTNKLIGSGMEMSVVNDLPTKHWSSFFEPTNFPFFLLNFEQAFALKWWLKALFLLVGSYLFILELTKGKYNLAIGASIFIFFTPFVHWWYSSQVPEILGYFFISLLLFIKIVNFKNKLGLSVSTLLFTYFVMCTVNVAYIPFVIPPLLLALLFGLGYLFNLRKKPSKQRLFYILGALGVSAVIIIFILLNFYFSFKDTIQIISNSVYPGQRIITGGGYSIVKYFFGFYDLLLQKPASVPTVLGNQSEISSALLLFPYLVPIYLVSFFKTKNKRLIDLLIFALIIYFLLISIWDFIGLPKFIAKILLFDRSPLQRFTIGLSAGNLIIVFYYLAYFKEKFVTRNFALIISTCAFLINLVVGFQLETQAPNLIPNFAIIFGISLCSFIIVYLLITQKIRLFLMTLIGFSILSTFIINPLYIGLSPLTKTNFSKAIRQLKPGNWAVYDQYILANYIAANGIKTVNGTLFYTQRPLMRLFDPSEKYQQIWNRYAHVTFETTTNTETIMFSLVANDSIKIQINPCNSVFSQLNVNYVILTKKADYSCLKQINEFYTDQYPIYIYQNVTTLKPI